MTAAARFEDANPRLSRRPGILQALHHRFTWRVLAAALGLGIVFNGLRALERATDADPYPAEFYVATALMQSVGALCILVATIIGDEAVVRGASRWRAYSTAVVAGAAIASLAQLVIRRALGLRLQADIMDLPPQVMMLQPLVFFFELCAWGTIGVILYVSYQRARSAAAARHATEVQRAFAQRRTLETRLRALQARVEPAFLLDTLAHVRAAFERNDSAGIRMLDELIAYLRAALPRVRQSATTLGAEVDLAGRYLQIMRLRLHNAFDIHVDLPRTLESAPIAPMLLLPLAAALTSGIERARLRASVRIQAYVQHANLFVAIVLEGCGEVGSVEPETLRRLQERLGMLHAGAATLTVERFSADTCRALIMVPDETAPNTDR
jgi:hypothetical protein